MIILKQLILKSNFEDGELPQMCGGIADKQGIFDLIIRI